MGIYDRETCKKTSAKIRLHRIYKGCTLPLTGRIATSKGKPQQCSKKEQQTAKDSQSQLKKKRVSE